MHSDIREVLKPWGIVEILSIQSLQNNVALVTHPDGRQVVLKEVAPVTKELIERIQFEREVLNHVMQSGVAAAVPLLTADGLPYSVVSGQVYKLTHWLPNRPGEITTTLERKQLYQSYGRAIGKMHLALASYKDENILNRTWRTSLQKRVFDDALPILYEKLDRDRLAELKTLQKEIRAEMLSAYSDLPEQLIIWDCHPGNTAVDGYEVSGFLDCDLMSIAPRIFDIAYMLVHLIKWDIGNEAKEQEWMTHFPLVVSAYTSVSKLSEHELGAIYYAMVGIPLIFMDYFVKVDHQDAIATEMRVYKWLVQTRDELLKRSLG